MVQGGLTRGYRGLPRPVRARGGRRLGWNLVRWSGRRYGWSLFGLLGWLAVGFSLRRRRRVRGRLRDLGAAFHGDSLAQNLASGLPGIIGRTVRTKAGRTATRGRWEKGQASSRRSKASKRSVSTGGETHLFTHPRYGLPCPRMRPQALFPGSRSKFRPSFWRPW